MNRETVKILIAGHVDHGKSTLIGRLMLETDSLPKEKLDEVRKISKELGKDAELAFLTDQLKEERERSMTIDTTQIFFKTKKRNYAVIDSPGHLEFIKNMITGASQAEAAVLIVDVSEGVREQTRRHAFIIDMLGIKQLIVVFNKMDLINYEEKRFEEVKAELLGFMETLKIKPYFLIPISAKEGVNVTEKSTKITWYKGPALLKGLNSLKIKTDIAEKPLRFPVQDVYELNGEKIIAGKIVSGIIKQGQNVIFLPYLKEAGIRSIAVFGKSRKRAAYAEENIGLILDKPLSVKRGDVITQKENPPELTSCFKGNIFWMSGEPLQVNKTINLRCATQEVKCIVEKIEKRINSSTLEIIEEGAEELKLNETGEVIFKTESPIVIERFSFIENLGRFVVEQGHDLQGAGIIT